MKLHNRNGKRKLRGLHKETQPAAHLSIAGDLVVCLGHGRLLDMAVQIAVGPEKHVHIKC